MTRYRHLSVQHPLRNLRPSAERVAGAAAVYDPGLLLQSGQRWIGGRAAPTGTAAVIGLISSGAPPIASPYPAR